MGIGACRIPTPGKREEQRIRRETKVKGGGMKRSKGMEWGRIDIDKILDMPLEVMLEFRIPCQL